MFYTHLSFCSQGGMHARHAPLPCTPPATHSPLPCMPPRYGQPYIADEFGKIQSYNVCHWPVASFHLPSSAACWHWSATFWMAATAYSSTVDYRDKGAHLVLFTLFWFIKLLVHVTSFNGNFNAYLKSDVIYCSQIIAFLFRICLLLYKTINVRTTQ